jgi:tetratricopeptide (TPR) repeat protein
MTKAGRNVPCPCGIGKKEKKRRLEKDRQKTPKPLDEIRAQDLVYDGWEVMAQDPREAKKYFERAIKLDPDLADAYNGLAEVAISRGNFSAAEDDYRKAYEKAKARLGTEDKKSFAWWGELETRPYMRARHGLGLLYLEAGRFDEAIGEFKDLLWRNPNDNQGVRYLVAPTHLLKNDLQGALGAFDWYKNHYSRDIPDPHFLLSWALAIFMAARYEISAAKFRSTIFENPYLIPLILGEEPEVLPIWHSNNLMQLDYAYEYFKWYGNLWIGKGEAVRFLQFIWEDQEIQGDYKQWVELWTKLKRVKDVDKRIPIIDLTRRIENKKLSAKFLRRLREFLASRGVGTPGSPGGEGLIN